MRKASAGGLFDATVSTMEKPDLTFIDTTPPRYILHPSGWARTIWNVLDIGFTFSTGIYKQGVLEPRVIACTYLRTWFPLDLVLVTFDWMSIIATRLDYQWTYALRLMRLSRVLRLGKMSRTALNVKEAMHSWAMNVQYSIFMNIFLLLLMNHMNLAGLARAEREDVYDDREFLYRYTTSLHWALSQLGVSSTQIEATNTTERIYSIFVAFVSLITFSTMVSSMTSMMGTWYKEKEEERKQFSSLQRYLRHNAIPPALSQRVTHFLQHAASERKAMVSDSHVELLDLLSKPLRGELQLEKYRGSMVRMDFVAALLHSDSVQILDVMQLLATGAISNTTLGTKDVVFRFGMEALSCYLPVSGSLSYLQESQEHIPCVKWAAEMCLWTEWYYVGDLVADSVSQLLVLDMESFCETLSGSRVTQKKLGRICGIWIDNQKCKTSGAVEVRVQSSSSIPSKELAPSHEQSCPSTKYLFEFGRPRSLATWPTRPWRWVFIAAGPWAWSSLEDTRPGPIK
eukprot:g20865.t1